MLTIFLFCVVIGASFFIPSHFGDVNSQLHMVNAMVLMSAAPFLKRGTDFYLVVLVSVLAIFVGIGIRESGDISHKLTEYASDKHTEQMLLLIYVLAAPVMAGFSYWLNIDEAPKNSGAGRVFGWNFIIFLAGALVTSFLLVNFTHDTGKHSFGYGMNKWFSLPIITCWLVPSIATLAYKKLCAAKAMKKSNRVAGQF